MKVKIGNYIHRFTANFSTNYMNKKYNFEWPAKSKYSRFEKFFEKLESFVQSFYNITLNIIQDKRSRKIKIKIDHFDVWDMSNTLSYIIIPMLKEIKKDQSVPYIYNNDLPKNLRIEDSYNKLGWKYIIDEMIFSFNSKSNDWEDQFHTGYIEFISIGVDKDGNEVQKDDAVMFRLDKGPNDTSSFDSNGYNKYQKRITNGFRLFGKYFENLWT